uniref:glutaminase n=2 Tax=Cacopsylla melanoneura TaxID=428564 RepID=A0A8D8Q4E6_9HEMI
MVSLVPHHVFQIQLQRHFVSISSSSSHLVKLVNFKHARKVGVCLFKGPRTHDVSAFASPLDRPYSFTSDPKKLESDGKFPKEPPDQLLFDFYKNEDHLVPINKFIAALRHYGLRKSDPRLAEFMKFLRDHHRKNEDTGSPEMLYLDEETFKRAVGPNVSLISKCLFEEFIIPDFKCFTKHIEEFYYLCEPNSSGKVADYIPQLARADPKSWGVSVCTVDGQRYSIGKTNTPFTIQSCSKPLTYGIALEELTEAEVHQYVGQEPSGRNFNELILDHNKKPHNPMINAGAIVVCSLLKTLIKPEMTPSEKFDYIMNYFKRLAGGEHIGFNNAIFLSEKVSADRNYALGFYMREHKCYPDNTNMKEVMDFYFQVGLPAKSGVSGTMLIVVPNTMGIALWSPPLDPLGNSCRGVQFCEELVKTFNFHKYDNLRHASNKIDPRRHRFSSIGYSIVTLLFNAAAGNLTALRRFKVSGLDMSLSDYDGRTALHLAAAEGHEECVQFLIECGVDIDVKDRWGKTPLDEAKTFGHEQIIQMLSNVSEKSRSADSTREKSSSNSSEKHSSFNLPKIH